MPKPPEREKVTTTLDKELINRLRHLAIDKRCAVNDLLEEGIKLILEKYKSKKK